MIFYAIFSGNNAIANLQPYLDFAKSSSRHLTRSADFSKDFFAASCDNANTPKYKC